MPENRRKRIWKVYKIHFPNKPQNYIGITMRPIEVRVREHGHCKKAEANFYVHKWLREKEVHTVEILHTKLSKSQALKHEQLEIQKLLKLKQPILNRTIRKIDEQNYLWQWCTWHRRCFPSNYFHIDPRRSSGVNSRCKKCVVLATSLFKVQPPSKRTRKIPFTSYVKIYKIDNKTREKCYQNWQQSKAKVKSMIKEGVL